MAFTAPLRLNLGPGSPILDVNGKPLDLSIFCGADWVLTAPMTLPDGTTPLNLSNPEMQIREGNDVTSALILAPVLSASGNTVTVSIPGSLSLAIAQRTGAYDLFATRTDTGARVDLLYGVVTFVRPTTVLI